MEPTDISSELPHIAPLDADNIPNDNQAHYCFSCEEPMRGAYCIACGQKNDNMRRGVFSLIWELITSITAIEGRIWRTWRALLCQPGRVAREFANGRRSHWSSPIRVYLAMSILLFAFMGLTKTHLFGVDIDVQPKDGITKPVEDLTAKDLTIDVSSYIFPRQKDINERNKDKNFDLIELKINSYTAQDISAPDRSEDRAEKKENNKPETATTENIDKNIDENAGEDEADFNVDDLNIHINNRRIDSSRITGLVIGLAKNPVILTNSFNKWLPRLIFILMPFTILFSALFIRGRENAMLYDHLVHAAYLHAVAFLFLFVGIVLSRLIPAEMLFNGLFILLLIYLPLSLKRMFNRGWIKTIWTSYGVGAAYLIFLLTGLSFAIIVEIGGSLTR